MLNNPNWKSHGISLAGFVAWLEQQDPNRKYEYWSCQVCAIGQYAASIGKRYADVIEADKRAFLVTQDWNNKITYQQPWTFGAALERARRYVGAPQL